MKIGQTENVILIVRAHAVITECNVIGETQVPDRYFVFKRISDVTYINFRLNPRHSLCKFKGEG